MLRSDINWTNKSVKVFALGDDPINKMREMVGEIIFNASEKSTKKPPFDPFEIAKQMGIKVVPRHDIKDARTIPLPDKKFIIEYNPEKSKGRIRFSIAHELAHTLFADCEAQIRNRGKRTHRSRDDWQLEMLCNIGASEILMPIGSFPDLSEAEISVGNLLNLQQKFYVSTEALFLRAVKLTEVPCFIFCATRIDPDDKSGRYGLDYIVPSKSWAINLPQNLSPPNNSIVSECTAVGYQLYSDELWDKELGPLHIECVGIPAYPTHRYPRVIGIATTSKKKKRTVNRINYKVGDATRPKVKGAIIIAHVVNDKAMRWGGRGFAKFLKKKWRLTEQKFMAWRNSDPSNFRLGNIHKVRIDDSILVISMIAQHGYGPSTTPRVRYNAMKICLSVVCKLALKTSSSVHMPRIGCGAGGGSWNIVSELIENELCDKGVKVYVYDYPPDKNLPLFDM